MSPRDTIKTVFQFKPAPVVPACFSCTAEHKQQLTEYYGSDEWEARIPAYLEYLTGVDHYLSQAGIDISEDGILRDPFGCVWKMGNIHHLEEAPIKEPSLRGYRLPDVREYIRKYCEPSWEQGLAESQSSFRIISHTFALFERAWSLRGFNQLLMDMATEETFCEELIEAIADWMLESFDGLLAAPVDAVMLTDDYADQRGIIFGLERWQKLFLPHYRRLFARLKKAGVYTIMHVCGNAAPAVPDLIECGLDCLESLQPEAMDIYKLKREYGKDLRLWGGLGVQQTMPHGTPQQVRDEVKRLKNELGSAGGYILSPAKSLDESVPIENVIAYFEEAFDS